MTVTVNEDYVETAPELAAALFCGASRSYSGSVKVILFFARGPVPTDIGQCAADAWIPHTGAPTHRPRNNAAWHIMSYDDGSFPALGPVTRLSETTHAPVCQKAA
jgi:hypothetical protein